MKARKIVSVLLAAIMLMSLMGTMAFAEGADLVIANEADWSAFCASVAEGTNYEGQTVQLTADITTDQMVGQSTRLATVLTGKLFKGTFDGGGKTITFTYTTTEAKGSQSGIGVFSALDGAVVQNLNVEANITDTFGEYAVGGIAGYMVKGALVDNCHVSGTISAVYDAGGIVGKGMNNAKITNSSNTADITTVNGKTGGIASSLYYPPTETGALLIENCTNSGAITATTGGYTGGIIGLGTGTHILSCSNSGIVTGNATSIGGIVGELQYCGVVDGCENTGEVMKNGNGYGAGGIIGWLRYPQSSAYNSIDKSIAVVKNNTNRGSVTSDGGHTGGLIGVVYNAIEMADCANYGLVTAAGMSGMVIGNYQKTETPIAGVTNGVSVTGCANYAREANLSGGSVGVLFGHLPENPAGNPTDYTIENNQSVVVTNTASPDSAPLQQGSAEVEFVETATIGKIRFVQEQNNVSVYLDAAEAGQFIENFVAAELTIEMTGDLGLGAFTPASDALVIDDRGNGTYLIREREGEDGVNDLTGNAILLGSIAVTGYGTGTIGLKANAPAQMQRRIADNIVVSSELTFETAAVTLEEATHTLTVNIAFNNNVAEGNTAAYQDMQVVITGANGEKAVYELGSGEAADKNYITYTAGNAVITADLPENVRYTVAVSGAGYRTAKKSVVLKEDAVLNFWNNVKDAADENGETKNFLAGEIVNDGKINVYDLSAVVSYFGELDLNAEGTSSDYAKYDLNRDGKVDSKDVAMVLVSWNE